jgi:hypothetical protein
MFSFFQNGGTLLYGTQKKVSSPVPKDVISSNRSAAKDRQTDCAAFFFFSFFFFFTIGHIFEILSNQTKQQRNKAILAPITRSYY